MAATPPAPGTTSHDPACWPPSPRPQPLPTGRLLTAEDVSPALTGRQAELFWPDDGKWYLIQFNAIYLDSRKAE